MDEYIIRFAKSYPNVIENYPKRLWNYYKYSLSNWRYVYKTPYHDLSNRAKELNLLPDGTAIIDFYISEVMDKYKNRTSTITSLARESEGTIQNLIDLSKARREILRLINPYLTKVLQETDFTKISDRFYGKDQRSWGVQTSLNLGKRETNEPKKRRTSFRGIVRKAVRGIIKSKRVIFEELIQKRETEWNPLEFNYVWFLTGSIQFDYITRKRHVGEIFGLQKTEVNIIDFDDKFVGEYGLIPNHQWSKDFVYVEGDDRFVFLEKYESSAIYKGMNARMGQPLIIYVKIPNNLKLYPYIYNENAMEYDGPISKENILEKYIYIREFDSWIYNHNLRNQTDSTSDYYIETFSL